MLSNYNLGRPNVGTNHFHPITLGYPLRRTALRILHLNPERVGPRRSGSEHFFFFVDLFFARRGGMVIIKSEMIFYAANIAKPPNHPSGHVEYIGPGDQKASQRAALMRARVSPARTTSWSFFCLALCRASESLRAVALTYTM